MLGHGHRRHEEQQAAVVDVYDLANRHRGLEAIRSADQGIDTGHHAVIEKQRRRSLVRHASDDLTALVNRLPLAYGKRWWFRQIVSSPLWT